MRILFITPPMTQLNTPYPATAYLTGYLKKTFPQHQTFQVDATIDFFMKVFCTQGLLKIKDQIEKNGPLSPQGEFFLIHANQYIQVIDATVRFLQGKDPSLALRIVSQKYLPEGLKFRQILESLDENEYLDFAFGTIGIQDRAKFFATLMIDELAEVVRNEIDDRFELSRYGEKLAASTRSFEQIDSSLQETTLLDVFLDELTTKWMMQFKPDLVGISLPFPGNVYGGFRIAKKTRELLSKAKVVMGGGYVNTELRSLSEPNVFKYVDYITLDDGEKPLQLIIENMEKGTDKFLRTFMIEKGAVVLRTSEVHRDVASKDTGVPTYEGLHLSSYLSLLEMLNPMHRLWSDARWNKITLAHGCYWKKCSFCDVSLDYIARYEPSTVDQILERMQSMMLETGQSGFHFVDEAAPPALLRALSERILEKGLQITWWGNVRFDKAFDEKTALLMAKAGCVAVTGGLEVASDRLLQLMQKGVSIEQVTHVTKNFNKAGILVHAYLMYGFPTETTQETVDSLEVVRQLFKFGCLDSAYWHRFSATIHSPVGRDPEKFGIKIIQEPIVPGERIFAINDLKFIDPTKCDHDNLGKGLNKGLYNYMHGIGLEEDVRVWFEETTVPKTKVPKNLISQYLSKGKKPKG